MSGFDPTPLPSSSRWRSDQAPSPTAVCSIQLVPTDSIDTHLATHHRSSVFQWPVAHAHDAPRPTPPSQITRSVQPVASSHAPPHMAATPPRRKIRPASHKHPSRCITLTTITWAKRRSTPPCDATSNPPPTPMASFFFPGNLHLSSYNIQSKIIFKRQWPTSTTIPSTLKF